MCGVTQLLSGLTGGLIGGKPQAAAPVGDYAAQQAATDAAAAQSANAKLAARNKRTAASLLATGATDTGTLDTTKAAKTVLGA